MCIRDRHLNVPGLRRQPQGHFALVSGLRYDPVTYSLYLHEPVLTALDLPLGATLQGEQLKAMSNELLADYARNVPVYTPVSYTHLDVYKRQPSNMRAGHG